MREEDLAAVVDPQVDAADVPLLKQHVTDLTGTLSAAQVAELEAPLAALEQRKGSQSRCHPESVVNGAGHGSTVEGPRGQYWHFGSMALSVNVNWERRISMYPTFFDNDGLMYSNTSFGDYPHFAPAMAGKKGDFAGWMLLSYNKPVKSSGYLETYSPDHVTDENVKTFWLAEKNNEQQWIQIDLLNPAKVFAVQVNYHDYKSDLYGRVPGLMHRYLIEGSMDGKAWRTLVDRKNSFKDVPNDYVELGDPARVRYIRYKNIHVPTPNLAISGLRIFGIGEGKKPEVVSNFRVNRHKDRRDATITWNGQKKSQGYNVLWGIAPDKLYNSWMVYGKNQLQLKSLSTDQVYYFSVEAFNENGISKRSKIMKAE